MNPKSYFSFAQVIDHEWYVVSLEKWLCLLRISHFSCSPLLGQAYWQKNEASQSVIPPRAATPKQREREREGGGGGEGGKGKPR